MLHKTRGIVFKTTDYSESSVVVQIFTEKFGLQSYLINGVKKPKAKISRNMLQPLHLVDMVVYHKAAGNIQRIAELKNSPVLLSIPYDIIKSCIAMFLNEVLYKAVKQQTPDENIFDFIFNAIEWLDNATRGRAAQRPALARRPGPAAFDLPCRLPSGRAVSVRFAPSADVE